MGDNNPYPYNSLQVCGAWGSLKLRWWMTLPGFAVEHKTIKRDCNLHQDQADI